MNISKYISELLYKYDCVIIPNFGGFLTKYLSAKINPVNNYFFPPSKTIAFNANLKNNDGLVANYISNSQNISFIQANKQILIFVNELNKKLKDSEHIELSKIGTLYLDIENNLQFTPDTSVNYLNDSFGLTSFHSPTIERQTKQQKFEKKFINKQNAYQQKKHFINSKLAVAASILLLIGMTLYIKSDKNIFDTNYTNIVSYFKSYSNVTPRKSIEIKANKNNNTNTLKSANTANISNPYKVQNPNNLLIETKFPYSYKSKFTKLLNNSDTKINDNNIKTTDINKIINVDKSVKPNAIVLNQIQKKYYIIGGCFGVSKNAENFLSHLKNNGFDAQFIGKTKSGLQRVAYCCYNSKKQTINKLAIIKSEENPSAWIFKNK